MKVKNRKKRRSVFIDCAWDIENITHSSNSRYPPLYLLFHRVLFDVCSPQGHDYWSGLRLTSYYTRVFKTDIFLLKCFKFTECFSQQIYQSFGNTAGGKHMGKCPSFSEEKSLLSLVLLLCSHAKFRFRTSVTAAEQWLEFRAAQSTEKIGLKNSEATHLSRNSILFTLNNPRVSPWTASFILTGLLSSSETGSFSASKRCLCHPLYTREVWTAY